jgi:ubiquinone/menaquinone biosynthesis C-methylase UbiE
MHNTAEQNISEAFSKQSAIFDELDQSNPIIQWMRTRIRQQMLTFWKPGERILELNAGTGLDAIFYAEKGFYVHAIDNAEGMIVQLQEKIAELKLRDRVTAERCSFFDIGKFQQGNFDHIFSNFGGLNCTDKVEEVIAHFFSILKPYGTVTLVLMPPICPWELLLALKGNSKVAFRRLKKDGTPSNVEGINFNSYYYSPSNIVKMFGKGYKTVSIEGLGIVVPPPYMEKWAEKHPKALKALTYLEAAIADMWPVQGWADHFMITVQKRA